MCAMTSMCLNFPKEERRKKKEYFSQSALCFWDNKLFNQMNGGVSCVRFCRFLDAIGGRVGRVMIDY